MTRNVRQWIKLQRFFIWELQNAVRFISSKKFPKKKEESACQQYKINLCSFIRFPLFSSDYIALVLPVFIWAASRVYRLFLTLIYLQFISVSRNYFIIAQCVRCLQHSKLCIIRVQRIASPNKMDMKFN